MKEGQHFVIFKKAAHQPDPYAVKYDVWVVVYGQYSYKCV